MAKQAINNKKNGAPAHQKQNKSQMLLYFTFFFFGVDKKKVHSSLKHAIKNYIVDQIGFYHLMFSSYNKFQ